MGSSAQGILRRWAAPPLRQRHAPLHTDAYDSFSFYIPVAKKEGEGEEEGIKMKELKGREEEEEWIN